MQAASAKVVHDPLVREIAHALRHRCGYQPRPHRSIVVGCSAGGDSQALLHALCWLSGRRSWPFKVILAHVNHHLTEQSDEAEALLREQADRLGITYAHRSIHPHHHGGNLENTARKQRHAALRSIAHEHDASAIALAHHADDQLETMLMRLLRGASPAGLAGMAWTRQSTRSGLQLIRPMLAVTHAQALDFLQRHEIPWLEDPLNSKPNVRRNRLRAGVLPTLRESWPNGHERALDAADQLRQWARFIDAQARHVRDHFQETPTGPIAQRDKLAASPDPLLATALRAELLQAGVPSDRLKTKTLQRLVPAIRDRSSQPRHWHLANDITVTLDHRSLRITMRSGPDRSVPRPAN
ncbi:tRNA lysidine(34) synthetase TilS [Mucisphaera sp.]|uniref:tRNA lysidine(34) synthetase TilS n=1 Tax=Mucisphaera sp. TaxID=2913024 RepID=UPI003D0FF532